MYTVGGCVDESRLKPSWVRTPTTLTLRMKCRISTLSSGADEEVKCLTSARSAAPPKAVCLTTARARPSWSMARQILTRHAPNGRRQEGRAVELAQFRGSPEAGQKQKRFPRLSQVNLRLLIIIASTALLVDYNKAVVTSGRSDADFVGLGHMKHFRDPGGEGVVQSSASLDPSERYGCCRLTIAKDMSQVLDTISCSARSADSYG